MKVLPFTPEKDPSNNPEKIVLQGMRFRIFASVAFLEGVHAQLYEKTSERSDSEVLDVSRLETPQDIPDTTIETKTEFTEMNITELQKLAQREAARMYSSEGLFIGGQN